MFFLSPHLRFLHFETPKIPQTKSKAMKAGSSVKLINAVRYEVGEGMEKKEENFAEEVAKQIGK